MVLITHARAISMPWAHQRVNQSQHGPLVVRRPSRKSDTSLKEFHKNQTLTQLTAWKEVAPTMAVAVKLLFPTTRAKPSRSSRAGQAPALTVKAAQTRLSTLISRRKLPAGTKSSLLGKSPPHTLLSLLFYSYS